jgi:hypothetical protein
MAQLVRNRDHFAKEVNDVYQASRSNGIGPSSDDFLLMLESQMKLFSRVYVVVDALDECHNDTETSILNRFLKALHQLPVNAHVLFTSRHDVGIGQRVQADLELEITARDDDLRTYFDSQINSVEHLKKLVGRGIEKDRFFRDNVLNTVVAKSQGM